MSDDFTPTPLPIEGVIFKVGDPRPDHYHPVYVHNVACKLWKNFSRYVGGDLTEDDFIALKEYINDDCGDGFEIAQRMDSDGFAEGSTELCEMMDRTDDYNIRNTLVKKWITDTGVTPEFKVGDEVVGLRTKGKITDIHMSTGEYTVFDPIKHTPPEKVNEVLRTKGMVTKGTIEKWEHCKEVTNG